MSEKDRMRRFALMIRSGKLNSYNKNHPSYEEWLYDLDRKVGNVGADKWKALDKIDFKAIPDTTFTRDRTGAGSIEYFNADEPGISYPNGYYVLHPMPGNDVILYNPNDNNELDIRLDALHIMPEDATYDALNSLYRDRAKDSDVSYNALLRYNEDVLRYGLDNVDSYELYFNNEADGLLRNMFIEGTPEYIESKRYYPDKLLLREWNKDLLPYIDRILTYLETGERPEDILPEFTKSYNSMPNSVLVDRDSLMMDSSGNFYDEDGNVIGDSVILPEINVRAKDREKHADEYKSAFDPDGAGEFASTVLNSPLQLMDYGYNRVIDLSKGEHNTDYRNGTPVQNTLGFIGQTLSPTKWAGTVRSGFKESPWSEKNPGLMDNPYLDMMTDVFAIPAIAKGVKAGYLSTPIGKYTSKRGTWYSPAEYAIAHTPVGKRAIEVGMRITGDADPTYPVMEALRNSVKFKNRKRTFNAINYILTGRNKTGKPISLVDNPYQGYDANELGYSEPDVIDAFLYGKTPNSNFFKEVGEDPYTANAIKESIRDNYPHKNIKFYEAIDDTKNGKLPDYVKPSDIEEFPDDTGFLIRNDKNGPGERILSFYDAAGNRLQKFKDATDSYERHQDIWKYNAKDFAKKYFDSHTFGDYEEWAKHHKMLDFLLNTVDEAGNPIVVRTPWKRTSHIMQYGIGGHSFDEGGPKNTNREYKSANSWSTVNVGKALAPILEPISRTIMDSGETWALFSKDKKFTITNDDTSTAKSTYLMPRSAQRAVFLDRGYEPRPKDYGLVKKAVGNKNIPVYLRRPDDASREDVVPIGNLEAWGSLDDLYDGWYGKHEAVLEVPATYPTAFYISTDGKKIYQKGWDLNDYGDSANDWYDSNLKKNAAKALDLIGSPTVVTTGISEVGNFSDFYNREPELIEDMLRSKGLEPLQIGYDKSKAKDNPNYFGEYIPALPDVTIKGKRKNKKEDGGDITYVDTVRMDSNGNIADDKGNIIGDSVILPELEVTGVNPKNLFVQPNDNLWIDNGRVKNPELAYKGEYGAKSHAEWEKEHPTLAKWSYATAAAPFTVASAPLVTVAGDALAATSVGNAITSGLGTMGSYITAPTLLGAPVYAWGDAALSSAFAAHGIHDISENGVTPENLLEVAPLAQLAPALGNGVHNTFKLIKNGYDKAHIGDYYIKPQYNDYSYIRQIGDDAVEDMLKTNQMRSSAGIADIEDEWNELGALLGHEPEELSYMVPDGKGSMTIPLEYQLDGHKIFEDQMFNTGRPFFGDIKTNYMITEPRPITGRKDLTNLGLEWIETNHKGHTRAAKAEARAKGIDPNTAPGRIVVPLYNGDKNVIPVDALGEFDLYRPVKIGNIDMPFYRKYSYGAKQNNFTSLKDLRPLVSNDPTVRLYRATGTSGIYDPSPDGGAEFSGLWFTINPNKPQRYASRTVWKAKRAKTENPIELQYVDIPLSQLDKYKAENILKGRTDIEFEPTEDFLIPLEYPRGRVPLEGYTGDYLKDTRMELPKELPDIASPIPSKYMLELEELVPRYNKFAEYYLYPLVPEGTSLEEAEQIIKNGLDRHNTFYRGLHMPSEEETAAIRNIIGKDATDREVLEYLAKVGSRDPYNTYLSLDDRAGQYARNADIAILKRKYKLGDSPSTWIEDADFVYDTTPATGAAKKGSVNYPWASKSMIEKAPPGEVRMHPDDFAFEGWLPVKEWEYGKYVPAEEFKGSNNLYFNEAAGHHKPSFAKANDITYGDDRLMSTIESDDIMYTVGDDTNPYKNNGSIKNGIPEFILRYFNGRKISGYPESFDADGSYAQTVKTGLPEAVKEDLIHNTVGRNVELFELYLREIHPEKSESDIERIMGQYKNYANKLMDDVKVGEYTLADYTAAGNNGGGFYDDARNFISVNTEFEYPVEYIMKHEGRHLLDRRMPSLTPSQELIIAEAYDGDFLRIPETEYAGTLKDYQHMAMERVTTNRDAREMLLNRALGENRSVDVDIETLNKIIDEVSDDAIFSAVRDANGYGKRYILLLKDTGRLTHEKADQFRNAMKKLGIIAIPTTIGLSR